MRRALLTIAFSILAVWPATAQVTGRAVVLDSDRFSIGDRIFQLNGVDGFEPHQFCFVDGRPWACGSSAIRALQTLLGPAVVTCNPTGEIAGEVEFAVCTIGEDDIADIVVKEGWALAYSPQSTAYVDAQEQARARDVGVWQGAFVEPWTYREDMAAIERRYAELTMEILLTEAEQILPVDRSDIGIFQGFEITLGVEAPELEYRIGRIAAGFIVDAIETRAIFTWDTPALALATWRQSVLASMRGRSLGSIWVSLAERPNRLIQVEDTDGYYAAMIESASSWIEQGRQPILLVVSRSLPEWVGKWFLDGAPEGAEIVLKDVGAPAYLGTIDGVDVYVGPSPRGASFLFPDDLLVEVAYSVNSAGDILTVELDRAQGLDEMVFRYSQSIEWLGDVVVWLGYPVPELDVEDIYNPALGEE